MISQSKGKCKLTCIWRKKWKHGGIYEEHAIRIKISTAFSGKDRKFLDSSDFGPCAFAPSATTDATAFCKLLKKVS